MFSSEVEFSYENSEAAAHTHISLAAGHGLASHTFSEVQQL